MAVKTSDGLNVFENSEETRTPAYLLFAVDDDQFYYLSAASQLNLTITPVPTNAKDYLDDEALSSSNITSDELKEYIDTLAEEFLQSTSYTTSDESDTNTETKTSGE